MPKVQEETYQLESKHPKLTSVERREIWKITNSTLETGIATQ